MKKAIVLLLALAVLGGAVFAQEASISGSATLSWGIDLDTQATGFNNKADLSLTFPLLAKGTKSKGADGDVYGYIEFKDLEWKMVSTDLAAPAQTPTGSITAKLVFKPFELSVYNKPSLAINKAAEISDGEVEYAGVGMSGTALKYISDSLTASVKVLSDNDWTANTANGYAIGSDVTFVVPDLMKINASVAYDLLGDTNFYAGLDAPVTLADVLYGLTFTPAADFIVGTTTSYDAMANLALNFAEANADDEQTNLAFKAYYSSLDKNIELSLSFDEYLAGGLVDNAEFGFAVKSIDLLEAAELPWALETYAGYKLVINEMNDLYGRVDFDIDSANVKNLTAKVVFTNIAVANTTFTVTYESKNLLADPAGLGTIIAAAKIKY